MFAYLRKPHVDLGSLILRLGLAAIFITHGFVFANQTLSLTDKISLPTQHLVGWVELVCGLALLIGLLARLAAVGVIVIMIGAIKLVTGAQDFLPISFNAQGYNFEAGAAYNFIIIVACLALLVLGSGQVSVDHVLFGRRKKTVAVGPAPVASPSASPTASVEQRV